MGIDPGFRGKKEKNILKSGAKGRIFCGIRSENQKKYSSSSKLAKVRHI